MEDDMRAGDGGAVAIDMGGAVQSYMQVCISLFCNFAKKSMK